MQSLQDFCVKVGELGGESKLISSELAAVPFVVELWWFGGGNLGGGGSFIRTGFWDTGGFADDALRFWPPPNRLDRMLMDWAWPGFFSAGTTFGGGGLGGGAFFTIVVAELPNGASSQLVAGLYRLVVGLCDDDACGGGGAGRDGIVIFLLIWRTDYCGDDGGGDDDEGNPTTLMQRSAVPFWHTQTRVGEGNNSNGYVLLPVSLVGKDTHCCCSPQKFQLELPFTRDFR